MAKSKAKINWIGGRGDSLWDELLWSEMSLTFLLMIRIPSLHKDYVYWKPLVYIGMSGYTAQIPKVNTVSNIYPEDAE